MGYDEGMAKCSSKPTDLNKRAAAIVAQSTDPDDEGDDPYEGKNPRAVELGRLGGEEGREGTRCEADGRGAVRDRTQGGQGAVVNRSRRE